MDPNEMADCRAQILGNIGYTELVRERPWDRGQVDELVELMVEAACSKRETIRAAGNEVPRALVRRRLLGLDGDHLNFVLDCLQRNTTQVRALCENAEEQFSRQGIEPRRTEGVRDGRWGVLDYGDVIVHVFNDESRLFYHLERLWDEGENVRRID